MDEMNEYTPDLYELIDEEGNKEQFELLDCMEYEGETYYAMTPFFGEDEAEKLAEDSGELVILRVEYDEETGEEILASIEDDDLYEKVGQVFLDRLEEMFGFEDGEE